MMTGLSPQQRVVVITGSARGIGFGLAEQFCRRGHRVVISDTDSAQVEAAVARLAQQYPDNPALGIQCDITDSGQLDNLWQQARHWGGRIDSWINNAGVSCDNAPVLDTRDSTIERVIRVNVMGTALATRVALRGMREQGFGELFNMAGFGSDGFWRAGMTIYGSSKRAVAYLSQAAAREVSSLPISVCWVNPGMVVTEMVLENARAMPAAEWAAGRRVFNLFGDTVTDATEDLVDRMLAVRPNQKRIHRLRAHRMLYLLLRSLFIRRDLFVVHGV